MKVSQKVDYAMRAMLEMALQPRQDAVVCTADIARCQRIPVKFLELILVELRRAGLVASQRGAEGGHRLARDADRISVGEIWRAVDSSAAETVGAQKGRGPGTPFREVWEQVDKAILSVVDKTSLADIKKKAEASGSSPDYFI
jgi:Rrf2 family protein